MVIHFIKFAQKHRISTDGRTDGHTDRWTRLIQYTPPQLKVGRGYKNRHNFQGKMYF